MSSFSAVDDETRDLLALHLLPGLGPRLTKVLLERFGSAARVRQAAAEELRTVPHIGEGIARQLADAFRTVNVDAELELLEKHECRLLRLGAPEYPEALATIFDPPPLLYVRGELLPADRNAVALVGSRHCTNYGRRMAERLAEDLARRGWTVVSGLARGIDGHAHRGALSAGGRTIAILAGGLARIYPPDHADLAEEIVRAGALLSEVPLTFAPMAGMFPARNRLISGLCRGVVVVEAAEKSGALITARHALEQSRDVFAVPGPVDSPASGGTLQLLKDGAILVRHVDDILDTWGQADRPSRTAEGTMSAASATANVPTPLPASLSDHQRMLLAAFGSDAIHADQLVQQTGLSVSEVGNDLLLLEMQGLVRRLPGNRFERR